MQAVKKKSRIDKADMLSRQNVWKVAKLTIATIGGVALFGVLVMALNFTITHAKRLNETIKL